MTDATPSYLSNTPLPPLPKILVGQKVLVTGANSGIGQAVAIAMGQAGADVAVNYVAGADVANAVVETVKGFGVKSIAIQADVSNEDQVSAMFKRAIAEFGTLDILVANAGLQRDAAFTEMTLAQWNTVMSVNLTGQFLCAHEAVREFKRRGIVPSVSRAAGKIISHNVWYKISGRPASRKTQHAAGAKSLPIFDVTKRR